MELIETFLLSIQDFQSFIPLIFFGLLLLAGLNIPISEDALLIAGGIFCSSSPFSEALYLYCWLLAGAYFSAWEAFGLGRWLGPRITKNRFFGKWLTEKHLDRVNDYFSKHGQKTLFFGRFIPFGFRNALFISAGASRLSFFRFALSDIPGCILSTCWLFFAAYGIGHNSEKLKNLLDSYHILVIVLLGFGALFYTLRRYRYRQA